VRLDLLFLISELVDHSLDDQLFLLLSELSHRAEDVQGELTEEVEVVFSKLN
jgi:hypothetical protein